LSARHQKSLPRLFTHLRLDEAPKIVDVSPMICLVYAHPYPDRSRANSRLLAAATQLPQLRVRALYDLYPDFAIDVETEQAELSAAALIVFQHPLYWYSVPGLLKHYFDKVLARGWAYGQGGDALAGKRCLWALTMGGEKSSYTAGQAHARALEDFLPPMEQTARFCQMHWEAPFFLFGAHHLNDAQLQEHATAYRAQLSRLSGQHGAKP
jgi:glutathione-regulated potassium-efflux system ancillary protein KefF